MLGGQAAIGTLNPKIADAVMIAIDLISREEFKIGAACLAFRRGSAKELGALDEYTHSTYDEARRHCSGQAGIDLLGAA